MIITKKKKKIIKKINKIKKMIKLNIHIKIKKKEVVLKVIKSKI